MARTSDGCNDAPRVNYFSNPDVSLGDKPTGTAENDNARTIEENMVRVGAAMDKVTHLTTRKYPCVLTEGNPSRVQNWFRLSQAVVADFRTSDISCTDDGETCTATTGCCTGFCGSAGVCGELSNGPFRGRIPSHHGTHGFYPRGGYFWRESVENVVL